MNESKNLQLLGHSQNRIPEAPDRAILDAFPNRNTGRSYWVHLNCHDFSSLCPVTGQPDAARILMRYMPDKHCVETKSLKYYLASFRNHADFNEDIINRIADDLIAVINPRRFHIKGRFASRGGIQLTVKVSHPQKDAGGS